MKDLQLGRNNSGRNGIRSIKGGVTHSTAGNVIGMRRRLPDGGDIVMLGLED